MPTENRSYFNLGSYTRNISNASTPESQVWFDRGMVWMFNFNHEEAVNCFEKALTSSPSCAMASWGIAYSIGPNYNMPWEVFSIDQKKSILERASHHLKNAAQSQDLPAVERDIIEALSIRFPAMDNADHLQTCLESFSSFHDAYADAMRKVYAIHSNDLDVILLVAEALMNRTPWKLWNLRTGQAADDADTAEIVQILEKIFSTHKEAWGHPGLLHMYIHLMEMSPHPERALRHGDVLSTLVPDGGHLIHMASHIDSLCGYYDNVVARNSSAIMADQKFADRVGVDNFYSLYRMHNYHFKVYGAMFLGQPSAALQASEDLLAALPISVLRPMANYAEGFLSVKQHALVRFGMWNAILAQTLPDDADLYCVTTAMMHYARTVAMANTNDICGAVKERELFVMAKGRVPTSRWLHNNKCADLLDVACQMLSGELEYRKGNVEEALSSLHSAIDLEDNLPYDEPWGWMQPVRHALGALLMEDERFDEAEVVYREDLGLLNTLSRASQHPQNVWSLHGLHECLQHRREEVESLHVKQFLDRALARAEVPIGASCFCRRATKHGRVQGRVF